MSGRSTAATSRCSRAWVDGAGGIRLTGDADADADIEPAWADEAFADDDALVDSPDPASKSGKTDRLVGYSTARMVIVVVYLHDELIGVNAWKANETQTRRYWEEQR